VLELIGLNRTDEAVYILSLHRPTWSAARLSKELGLTEETVVRSRETLIARGLLRPDPLDPTQVIPLGPDLILDSLMAEEEARAAQRREQVARARAELSALVTDYLTVRTEGHGGIERLEGVHNVRLRLAELARATEREVLSFHPEGPQSGESLRTCLPLDLAALRRGVAMRAIYLHEIATDEATWDYVQQVVAEGAQVRTTANLPTRLTIIDQSIAVVPAEQNVPGGSALVIHGTGILTALLALFERHWTGATGGLCSQGGGRDGGAK
jgi:hypothetical protein